jgi:CRISPR-associated protein Csm5
MTEYEISVQSPVHIGSGDQLDSMDFVVHNGRASVIDFDKVLSELKNKGESPLVLHDEIERFGKNFDFGKFLYRKGINVENVSKYTLPCEGTPSRMTTFIKNAFGIPLMPGSSIKGAIRTALTWYFLKNENMGSEAERALRRVLGELNRITDRSARIRASRGWERRIGQELENLIFYGKEEDPKYDINKAMTVTDASLESVDLLELALCRIFTVTRENRLVPKPFDIFVEAIKPSTHVGTAKISLDSYFLEEKLLELGFNRNQVITLRKFPHICNEFSKNLIEYELDFFDKYELPELVQFYENLLDSFPETDDEFLLRLGFGIGWISTTIGLLLGSKPDLLKDIRREFWLGRRRNQPYYVPEFPKTRNIIVDGERPNYPMGWIKLREAD